MPHADGIQAHIISNGTPLAEYSSPTTDPSTVFCESTPGQTFEVKLSGPKAHCDCIVKLHCDGVFMKSYAYPRHHRSFESTFCGIYLPNDDTRLMPFKFSKIELSEEDDSHPEQVVKNLGTVSLEFFHCSLGKQKPSGSSFVPSVASNTRFSERNKKASMIPHSIGLGESTIALKARSSVSYDYRQIDSTSYLRFVWQYRSRNMLITAGLIPRPPSPLPDLRIPTPPRPAPQNSESRTAQRKSSSLGINGDGQRSSGPSTKTTEGETKPEVNPKTSGSKSVVIDLCDDDDRPIVQPMVIRSCLKNPIILDDDDDEQIIQPLNKDTQASSSLARKVDVKPARIKLETRSITDENEASTQTKRALDESEVDELDEKRVKLEI